jgi:hypothetical protein
MKKYLFIIVLMSMTQYSARAQNFEYKGLNVFANAHYMNVILNSQSGVGQPISTTTSVSAQPNFGLSAEAVFSIKKNLNINAGLGVNTVYFKQGITGLKWGTDFDPQLGFRPSTTYFDSKLIALNAPIKLNYVLNSGQSVGFGLTTSVRFNKKSSFYTLRDDDKFKTIISDNSEILVRNINFILSADYTFKIKLTDKINFLIQPYAAIHVLGDELKLFYTNNYFFKRALI